jgi:hypothetical protein
VTQRVEIQTEPLTSLNRSSRFAAAAVVLLFSRRMKMCRSIKPLFNFDPPVTPDEIRAASLQFVRKISGFHKPSKTNAAAFDLAIDEIAAASHRLLRSLETSSSPRNRELEAAKAKARASLVRPLSSRSV